jgi:hypothetical protein
MPVVPAGMFVTVIFLASSIPMSMPITSFMSVRRLPLSSIVFMVVLGVSLYDQVYQSA